MKRINEYKKLFDIQQDIELKSLKTTYKRLVKEWHPDKFLEGNPLKVEAEFKSRQIIDGYHFLVSIAPETIAENLEEYTLTINETRISDFKHKGLLLEITFSDGATYEFFGVNKNVYTKFIQSGNETRFAKRNIYNNYLYRKSKKAIEV
jgi:curved DNA-binding protein CbpA